MGERWANWLITGAAVAVGSLALADPPAPAAALAADSHRVAADPPSDLAVTVYRNPNRQPRSLDSDDEPEPLDLDNLQGFALIRETRLIHIPAGESTVRFEGVAEGIEPASALIDGLPEGLIEKNRDARLLSPGSLMEATVGKDVMLWRSDPKSGHTEHLRGRILSDTDGVVFQSEAGIEALRCSSLSETFTFNSRAGLSATPTLSILIRTRQPLTKVVTLSYLARGFDWTATYTATLSADATKMDLGAWVTLANSNGTGFPAAHTQVVAGRLNRANGEIEPIDLGAPIVAKCWPEGNTSSPPELLTLGGVHPLGFEPSVYERSTLSSPMAAMALQEVVTTGRRVIQEQLGDLKLYRVPERTTVASRQSKQVRMLDRKSIPVQRIYVAWLNSNDDTELDETASVLLRTENKTGNNLGLPLPSGTVAVFATRSGDPLLLNESPMNDLAVGEDVEISAGRSADVTVSSEIEDVNLDPSSVKEMPLVPGIHLRQATFDDARRVVISNAHDSAIRFELRLQLDDYSRLVRADHPVAKRYGRPVFRLTIPAHAEATVRYQTARFDLQAVPVLE